MVRSGSKSKVIFSERKSDFYYNVEQQVTCYWV